MKHLRKKFLEIFLILLNIPLLLASIFLFGIGWGVLGGLLLLLMIISAIIVSELQEKDLAGTSVNIFSKPHISEGMQKTEEHIVDELEQKSQQIPTPQLEPQPKSEPEPKLELEISPKPEPEQESCNLQDERKRRIRKEVQEEDNAAYRYHYESETQSKFSYDYAHIQHVLARLTEMGQGEKLYHKDFLDLCTKMNKEYERVGKDLATAITNHYLMVYDYPTPEVLADKTGISVHYCYLLLQEFKKNVGHRMEELAEKKGMTAHDILYKTETITNSINTGKIIGYNEIPYTSCRTLAEESCYLNSGGHYEYRKEPIYEYKTTQRTVQSYQMDNLRPFVPQTFIKLVSGRWSKISSSSCLDFDLLHFYVNLVYPE